MRAITPNPINKKMKIFMYSQAGLGKTLAALQFPNALIIDMERGTDMYSDLIITKNSKVLKTRDYKEAMEEIEDLRKNNHKYGFKTLIIDPITIFYDSIQEDWHDRFAAAAIKRNKEDTLEDFGTRYWQKLKRPYKLFLEKVINLDMHIICTAHEKDKFKGQSYIGVTYNSRPGDDHLFDFVFRFVKEQGKFVAITEKQRKFPKIFPDKFEWNYKNLIQFVDHDLSVDNIEYEENNKIQEESNKTYPSQSYAGTSKTEKDIPKTNKISNKKLTDIINTLSKEKITKDNFADFLVKVVKWEGIKNIDDLTEKQINTIWENLPRIIDKYKYENRNTEQEAKKQNLSDSPIALAKKELAENIKATGLEYSQFVSFLNEFTDWNIKNMSQLSEGQISVLNKNWNTKVILKINEYIKDNILQPEVIDNKLNDMQNETNKCENEADTGQITQEQIREIKRRLMKEGINVKHFLESFGINDWSEIPRDGADNVLRNFDGFISELK